MATLAELEKAIGLQKRADLLGDMPPAHNPVFSGLPYENIQEATKGVGSAFDNLLADQMHGPNTGLERLLNLSSGPIGSADPVRRIGNSMPIVRAGRADQWPVGLGGSLGRASEGPSATLGGSILGKLHELGGGLKSLGGNAMRFAGRHPSLKALGIGGAAGMLPMLLYSLMHKSSEHEKQAVYHLLKAAQFKQAMNKAAMPPPSAEFGRMIMGIPGALSGAGKHIKGSLAEILDMLRNAGKAPGVTPTPGEALISGARELPAKTLSAIKSLLHSPSSSAVPESLELQGGKAPSLLAGLTGKAKDVAGKGKDALKDNKSEALSALAGLVGGGAGGYALGKSSMDTSELIGGTALGAALGNVTSDAVDSATSYAKSTGQSLLDKVKALTLRKLEDRGLDPATLKPIVMDKLLSGANKARGAASIGASAVRGAVGSAGKAVAKHPGKSAILAALAAAIGGGGAYAATK